MGNLRAVDAQKNCNAATFKSTQAETSWATERAKDIEFLTVYDPTPLFCPEDKCLIMRDGKMLYRDGNHLSPYGADVLLQGLSPVLTEAFKSSRM
ncbi:MAG: SGNH hydrolase domain-containing protein [Litorimonas sp.]